MKAMMRMMKHLFAAQWQITRYLPRRSLDAIEAAISASEILHMGELRFAVEAGLDWSSLFAGMTSRDRAVQIFSNLGVWDTEHNSGVLIYLLLADRKVEIVADRGINALVSEEQWASICRNMEQSFKDGEFEKGVLLGISSITNLLKKHFPAEQFNPDDLPDNPVVL